MNRDSALSSLSAEELVVLVNDLQRQLAEKEQEVERLKRLVLMRSDQTASDEGASGSSVEPSPGSIEDLMTELERTYPLPKADG